jgi:hypothetical protein
MRAAICIAFAAFLRTGEFTYNTWNGSSHESLVSRGSIKFTCNAVTLTLPKSKTDPFAKGVQIPMPATNDPICPREALKSLISRFPTPSNAPLFACHNESNYKNGIFFTRVAFLNQLKDLLIKAGINPVGYNGHSFRKGAAQSAAAAGMPNEEIKILGRWKSDAINFIQVKKMFVDYRLRPALQSCLMPLDHSDHR